MTQFLDEYLDLKKLYPNYLLFSRVGGFYELYFDDAKLAASNLNIALNCKKINNQQIPFCGFPANSLGTFSNKLLQLDFKIAIAEQILNQDNPTKITRKVNKIITPGTITDTEFLNIAENVLLAIILKNTKLHLCFGDILLGNIYVDEIDPSQINQYLDNIKPAEILLEDKNLVDERFYSKISVHKPNKDFRVDGQIFKTLSKHHNQALQAMFDYISSIHNSEILQHFNITQFEQKKFLKISAKTRQNLQLAEVINNIDRTSCLMGKRFLQRAVNQPLAYAIEINDRLDGVEFVLSQNDFLKNLQNQLQNLPDLEKLIGKIAITKNATINDLASIIESLQIFAKIAEILFWKSNTNKLPPILMRINKKLLVDFELINFLKLAIDCTTLKIKDGFNPRLDNWQNLQQKIATKISDLEREYRHQSQIKTLKIEFNNLLGFYFEIKRDKVSKINIPKDWQLLQNLNNSIRFSCHKLKDLQLENVDLEAKIKALELKILQELVTKVLQYFRDIKNCCEVIGLLDLLVSFAIIAKENCYVRPTIHNQNKIEIISGTHPISNQFITNDCVLDKNRIWLITGANMAGKSTFLRQNALIILLAQSGSFIPAKQAEIAIRQQIFSKMIINDNLSKNQSSFMVEMIEMAEILNNADANSLVIIDELCQTTNNSEGKIIALSIIKYLLENNQSLALISSHNFDLAYECQNLANIVCKKISPSHKMEDGIAQESSAIEVARLVGLPSIFNNHELHQSK